MESIGVPDRTASAVLKFAKKFFADPKNQEKYRQWHYKEYGCYPEDCED